MKKMINMYYVVLAIVAVVLLVDIIERRAPLDVSIHILTYMALSSALIMRLTANLRKKDA